MKSLEEILQGEDIATFLTRCRTNFKFFCERVLSGTLGEEIKIQPFHLEWFRMFWENPRSVVIAARGTGKTTVLSVAFPLWLSLFFKHKHFMVVSNAMHQSVDIIEKIRLYIEENELLHQLKPKAQSLSWSRTELNTTTGCRIVAKPLNANIRGIHNDYLVCDEAGLYDDPNLFFRAIVPTVTARKGHIMVIGTPISQTDLLARLSENPAYKVKVYPIIIGKKLLWPEKYSREFIRKLRNELAPDDFAREYLCKIVDSEISVFPFKLLVKSFDKNLSFEQEPDGKSFYFVGCDFALAAKGDYSAFVVVKKREDGKIQLVNIYRTRGQPFEAQLETLKAIYNMYKPQKMLLDRSSFGEAFLSELAREGLPVTGFSFTQENRNSLFNSAIRKFQEQSIVIPYAERDMETVGQVDNLIKELTSFVVDKTRAGYATYVSRGKHDDCAIAFLLALKAAFEERPFLPYITSGTVAEKYPERFTIETH